MTDAAEATEADDAARFAAAERAVDAELARPVEPTDEWFRAVNEAAAHVTAATLAWEVARLLCMLSADREAGLPSLPLGKPGSPAPAYIVVAISQACMAALCEYALTPASQSIGKRIDDLIFVFARAAQEFANLSPLCPRARAIHSLMRTGSTKAEARDLVDRVPSPQLEDFVRLGALVGRTKGNA